MAESGNEGGLVAALLDASDTRTVIVAASGVITASSRQSAELLGRGDGELVGRPAAEVLGEDVDAAIRAGSSLRVNTTLASRGQAVDAEVVITPICGGGAVVVVSEAEHRRTLEEHAERYRILVETSPDAIIVVRDGVFVYVNRAGVELFGGLSAADLVGCPAMERVVPEDVDRVMKRLRHSVATGENAPLAEARIVRLDGRCVEVEVTGAAVAIDGQPAMQVLARDISARRRAETELRLLSRALEQSREAAAVIDPEGNILFSNAAFASMHGYRVAELEGRNLAAFHSPEQMPAVDAANRQIVGEGSFRGEIWHRHRDGHDFLAHMHNTLVRDPDGAPLGIIGTMRDITEEAAAARALRESEARYRNLVELSPDPVVILTGGRYGFANTAFTRVFGYTAEDVADGLEFHQLVPEHERDAVRERYQARSSGAELDQTQRIDLVAKDGSVVPCETSAAVIQLDGDSADLVIIRDITERVRAAEERLALENQVQQAQKLESLGVLACGIAHDFNNLLVGVMTNAGLARTRLAADARARAPVASIETAAQRGADLCDQLLAYAGRGAVTIEDVDVSAVVAEMRELLHVALPGAAALDWELATDLPRVAVDPTQLRQAVMNLVTNAAEAIVASGEIVLRTGVSGAPARVFVEVADTGCGMDEATCKRIFDPFFTTKAAGRGLGLATVLGFVRTHNGVIDVDSTSGQGTTFRVLIPIATVTEGVAPGAVAAVEELARKPGKRVVLVVDDEALVRTVVGEILAQEGLEVVTAEDGPQALDIFRERGGEIGLSIVDLTMPRMNGDELFGHIRALDGEARVLFSSGYHEARLDDLIGGDSGAAFIRKPFRVEELLGEIRRLLAL